MILTNEQNLPEAFVKAVTLQRHNKPGRLSATTILNGTKHIILMDRHWDDIEEDVSEHFWAIWGTTAHKVLEDEGADEFTEEFMSCELDGFIITGRIDNYNMRTGVITDWKNGSVWKIIKQDFDDWRKQGLIYAWLLKKNGFDVKTCQFIDIIRDHRKSEAKHKSGYPKTPLYVYKFDVTPEGLTKIETFLREKIAEYKQHREMADDDIPPCTAKERWDKPSKYAVKKEGRKTAVRVLNTQEEAEKLVGELGKNHYVEKRPGEFTRCIDYCSCCEFCNFHRDNVAFAEEQEADWPKE
jgi:hypothetical protein